LLISRGNLKLGVLPSFSLPVITTCPGKTPFCELYCYGLKGNFKLQNVLDANERRLDASLRGDFAETMVAEIRKSRAPAFRLHVVGDFYNVEYIEKWIDIAKRLPHVVFFGSTRSWRCDFLAEAMKKFRDMDNVYMKASIDLSDTLNPRTCGWRIWSIEGEGTPCPHDEGRVASCLMCTRCWSVRDTDVSFRLRWADPNQYRMSAIPI
jgi:hypothetical protein